MPGRINLWEDICCCDDEGRIQRLFSLCLWFKTTYFLKTIFCDQGLVEKWQLKCYKGDIFPWLVLKAKSYKRFTLELIKKIP
jgi:hypothetical protein